MKQIIECVPNISEGRDPQKIKTIAAEVEKVEGVRLLDIDPGAATNRTVITFVGPPEAVIEAALLLIKKAFELIDMSQHSGEHPRFGAVDVCPLIPISGVSMDETAAYAHELGHRIGEELGLSGYFYENAALTENRKNLATVRSGEYEGLPQKLANSEWKPDFGPDTFNKTYGVTAIGARDFLVAYNVNLNTTSVRRANAVAFDVREKGRIKRQGNTLTGEIVRDENGEAIRIPGKLKAVKAIGWYIEEYGIAQISMNLTDINQTSLHKAFEAVRESANARGMRVTGSELVGLVPLKVMLEAGKHFLSRQQRSSGIDEKEIIKIAVKSLGLDDLTPFDPKKKIIEYQLHSDHGKLTALNLTDFANETASESPAPGGGSIAAYVGALGAALSTMVANLSAHKRGWDDRWEYFSDWAERGVSIQNKLLELVDEDTNAFNAIIDAVRLSKSTEEEKELRSQAITNATKGAIEVPFEVMKTALASMEVAKAMAESGNPSSVSDAGVGALCARTAIRAAWLNVKINMKDFDDKVFCSNLLSESDKVLKEAADLENQILQITLEKIEQ